MFGVNFKPFKSNSSKGFLSNNSIFIISNLLIFGCPEMRSARPNTRTGSPRSSLALNSRSVGYSAVKSSPTFSILICLPFSTRKSAKIPIRTSSSLSLDLTEINRSSRTRFESLRSKHLLPCPRKFNVYPLFFGQRLDASERRRDLYELSIIISSRFLSSSLQIASRKSVTLVTALLTTAGWGLIDPSSNLVWFNVSWGPTSNTMLPEDKDLMTSP